MTVRKPDQRQRALTKLKAWCVKGEQLPQGEEHRKEHLNLGLLTDSEADAMNDEDILAMRT